MNQEKYNFVMPTSNAMYKAADRYGANINGSVQTASGFYNVGMDEVLRDIALTVLEAKEGELAKHEQSLEAHQAYCKVYKEISKVIEGNEKLRDMIFELDNQRGLCSNEVERERFIQGFIAGYKLLKNASLI